jgi:hypothetical protein
VGLAARSSVSRCFSANLSAASLFENVASTGPFASPTPLPQTWTQIG